MERSVASSLVALLAAVGAAVGGLSPSAHSAAPEATAAPPFVVIANPSVPDTALTPKELAVLFLKKRTKWSDGSVVVPLDLDSTAAARLAFSDRILDKSIPQIKAYWQQRAFSGRAVPPPELDTENELLRRVESSPGAIGYVSGAAELAAFKIKIISIIPDP
ncbi:MAG: phosphate ABC transporter substrate-binding protein [Candidatus Schekmanbacteria bacterium]|nr:phosphate ABC transporter substrate-binding protein [Candidatus Schekmanbacteria bacterium]